jgi:hypothetical protein
LLIPAERTAEVWGPLADGKQGWRIGAATRLDGAPHFPALVLELEEIWAG